MVEAGTFKKYSLYGLTLSASRALPGLVESNGGADPDIEILLGNMPAWSPKNFCAKNVHYRSPYLNNNGEPSLTVWQTDHGYFHFIYADETEFVVNGLGTEIWARWPDEFPVEYAATYLLGPIMGFALVLRGTICLHASTVAVDDR